MLGHRAVGRLETREQIHAREVDVRVDQPWQRDTSLQIHALLGPPTVRQTDRWTDVRDRAVAHGDCAISEDAPLRVHGDDYAVFN